MEFIFGSSKEAFLHTGSMIGFFILIFSLINYYTDDKFEVIIQKNKNIQPIIGALIGAIPGCGGALAIVPLYVKGKVSFGTIIASLIASMGDASFLLIASNLKMYIFVISICIITGIIAGITVDKLSLGKKLNLGIYNKARLINLGYKVANKNNRVHNLTNTNKNLDSRKSLITNIYIIVLVAGFIVMNISHLGGHDHSHHAHSHAGHGFDIHSLELILAVIGMLLSVIITLSNKLSSKCRECSSDCKSTLKKTLIHAVEEISFVICWIFIAYLAYDIIVYFIGGEEVLVNFILKNGVISVLIGALLGIIPGCGVQIVLMSFYLQGVIPLGALIANAISQDGDALFPLIAMDKKSSIWATVITTIPAIVVGTLVYYLIG